jgi:hypothetical protein
MANPIVHFEIIGKNPTQLRAYYRELFGWQADTSSVVAPEISDEGQYGFVDKVSADEMGTGIPGGIGGGSTFHGQQIFYVGVMNVEAALKKAEDLGGKRVLGPVSKPDRTLVVGQFKDPEGNLIGVAGPK